MSILKPRITRMKFDNSQIRDKELVTTANHAKLLSLCPYVFFKPRITRMSFQTAKKREIIFMSLCPYVFFKPRITRMPRILQKNYEL